MVAHKDRSARFGFDCLEHVAASACVHDRQQVLDEFPLRRQRFLVRNQDFATGACRRYGLRRYGKALEDELAGGGR